MVECISKYIIQLEEQQEGVILENIAVHLGKLNGHPDSTGNMLMQIW